MDAIGKIVLHDDQNNKNETLYREGTASAHRRKISIIKRCQYV